MERIEKIHSFIELLKPEGQSGRFTPEQIDDAINYYIMEMFRSDIDAYQTSHKMNARLQKFETVKEWVAGDKAADGSYTLPIDYETYTGAGAKVTIDEEAEEVEMDILTEMEYRLRKTSQLVPPENEYPVCIIRGTKLIPTPSENLLPVLYYLKKPNDVKFNYTLQGSDGLDIVYTSTGSIQPEYPETIDFEILKGTLKYLGVSLKDELLLTTMEKFNQTK
jgi:hypothetical protein